MLDEKQIFDDMMKKGMDENEKALYAIAETMLKEKKENIAALIFAVLLAYRFELISYLFNLAIYPIIEATEIALEEMYEEMSKKN